MEREPVLAGCCLGLLTYKPQFGVLFLRTGLAHGFNRGEGYALAAAGVLLLIYIVATTQVGLAASLIVALLVGWRILNATHEGEAVAAATLTRIR
jgi:hypothetical protein